VKEVKMPASHWRFMARHTGHRWLLDALRMNDSRWGYG